LGRFRAEFARSSTFDKRYRQRFWHGAFARFRRSEAARFGAFLQVFGRALSGKPGGEKALLRLPLGTSKTFPTPKSLHFVWSSLPTPLTINMVWSDVIDRLHHRFGYSEITHGGSGQLLKSDQRVGSTYKPLIDTYLSLLLYNSAARGQQRSPSGCFGPPRCPYRAEIIPKIHLAGVLPFWDTRAIATSGRRPVGE
jgi:hypothetical protein